MGRVTDLEFVNAMRVQEIKAILRQHGALFKGRDLLEIGSGAGVQLKILSETCRSAKGIESAHRSDRITSIIDYDGRNIPFPDASFDVVFSSYVMEHVLDGKALHSEIHRVLRPGGICLHIVPTAAWRLHASLLHYPATIRNLAAKLLSSKNGAVSGFASGGEVPVAASRWRARLRYALIQSRHGESGNWLTEHFLFRARSWRNRFAALGWTVTSAEPVGFFQSGHYLLNERLSWLSRQRLASIIGSSGILFILREDH